MATKKGPEIKLEAILDLNDFYDDYNETFTRIIADELVRGIKAEVNAAVKRDPAIRKAIDEAKKGAIKRAVSELKSKIGV